VFSTRRWQRIALVLNFFGAALLFYSFQATSSDFRLVSSNLGTSALGGEMHSYALCVNDYALLASDARTGIAVGHHGCPNWVNARPAAVVNVEHPAFEGLGFILLLLGFLIQFLSVPHPATIVELRQAIKMEQANARESKRNRN
jgi:hypothetical protein